MRITENKTVDFSNGAKFPICCEWEWTLVVSDPVLCHNLCSALSVVTHILLCCGMGEYFTKQYFNSLLFTTMHCFLFCFSFWCFEKKWKNAKYLLRAYLEFDRFMQQNSLLLHSWTSSPANKEDYSPVLLCQTQGGHSEQFPRAAAKRTVKISQ